MKAARPLSVTWRGRHIRAMVPHQLSQQRLDVKDAVATACIEASTRLSLTAEVVPPDFVTLTHLMARHEALASSHIEGIGAPILDVVLPAITQLTHSINDAVDTVRYVRDHHDRDLSISTLLDWHVRLMKSTSLAQDHVGHFRDEQGWIGGSSPLDAVLVTPPPELLPELIEDLIVFANRSDIEPVLQAAVVHAQFELIHPFADGNGRLGRLLVDWVLSRRLGLVAPPSISNVIVRDIGGYLSGLTLFRMGDLDAWAAWFASVVTRSSQRQLTLVQSIDELKARWRVLLLARSDSSAWNALSLIPRYLVLDSRLVATELDISPRAALSALEVLQESGILEEHSRPIGKGRPSRLFVSLDLLSLVDVF